MTKPKTDPGTLQLEATCEELKAYYRITIRRGEDKCPTCGQPKERRPFGIIHVPRIFGIPKQIIITIQGKEE